MSMAEKSKRLPRRVALLGAGAVVAGLYFYGGPLARRWISPSFSFSPIAGLDGFRLLDAGAVSQNLDPLAGLETTGAASRKNSFQTLKQNLCGALFGQMPQRAGTVSIASFSDYRCPYCRILTPLLAEWQESDPSLNHVEWHEWPLLGGPSLSAARAALASKNQGAYPAMYNRLMRSSFIATPDYLKQIAETLDLDAGQLLSDMESPAITEQIETSRALAALFGFPGTPALVVGKTAVIGAISEADLYALIDLERREGLSSAC